MPFCSHCGNEISEKAVVCVKCGCAVNNKLNNNSGLKDRGGFGWGLLGFMVPIAGLILWLLWRDTSPRNARSAGIGALVQTILSVVFVILYFVFIFILIGIGTSSVASSSVGVMI